MAIVKIPVAVVNKIAMVDCGTVAVADNNNYVLEVTFDEEWAEYTTKTARFICGSWVSEKAFTGNTVEMPMLPPDYTHVRVGFYAGDISTTSPAKIAIVGSIMSNAPSEIEAAEIERVRAEAERAEAEAERVANEEGRITAELDRVTAEQERVDAELARQSAEDERITNEQERIANELIRIANEQERIAHGTLFIAKYGETTIAEIRDALDAGKAVICRREFIGASGTAYGEGTLRDMRGNLTPASVYIFDAYPWVYHLEYGDTWRMESVLASSPEVGNQIQLLSSGAIYDALQEVGKPPLKVTITRSGSTYTTDYSSAEIYAAWAEGRYVYAQFGRDLLTLGTVPTTSACLFKTTGNGTIYTQFGVTGNTATRTERNIISRDGTAEQNSIYSTLRLSYTPAVGTEAVNKEYVDNAMDGALDDYYTKNDTDALLDDKQDALTFDAEPTENSTNPVTSGGVYTALQGSGNAPLKVTITHVSGNEYASDYSSAEIYEAYLANRFVYAVFQDTIIPLATAKDADWCNFTEFVNGVIHSHYRLHGTTATRTQRVSITADGNRMNNRITSTLRLTYTPTNAQEAVNKQYVDGQIATRQPTLTFDNAPTAGSNNPVKSSGIYSALGTKVDKVTGKGLSTNDYTNADKAKVDNIPTATSDLTNDSDFQNSTEVNDAIAAALGSMTSLQYEIVTELPTTGAAGTVYLIQNGLSYDQYMWIGGQYYNLGSTAIDLSNYYTMAQTDTLLAAKQDALNFDAAPTVLSTNPVTSDGIYNALADKQNVLTFDNAPALNSGNPVTSEGLYLALQGKQNTLTFDGVPTALSPNPVTSAGLYTALEGKQAALTFDEQPIVNSRNPVTSSGIYAALQEKENRLTYDLVPTRNSGNPVTSGGVWSAIQGSSPADIQQMINDAIAGVTGFEYQVVAELPAAGEKGVIYLVPSPLHPDQTNEYVWIEGSPSGHFEAIGTTDIDLSDYYTKTETDALIDEVRVFEAQLNVTSAADIIQAVNDRKSIVVHSGAGSPSEFAVKAAISGADKVYLYTMTLNVGTDRSYPVFTRHVIEGTTWAVRNVGGAVTDDVPFIAEQGRTTPPQIEMATAKNRIIVVKATDGVYYPCINVSTTADHHTRLHCLAGSYDATANTFALALKVYDIYGATWTVYSTAMVTAVDLQEAVDDLNDRIDEVEATIGRFRGNYGSYALLAADSRSHRENDYAIVTVDETHANQCWYYTYSSDSVWVARFKIRDAAFTTAQLNAINSGATTAKIDSIANKLDKVTTSGKTEVYIHNGATQTVREIATSITSASADTSKLPTVAAVYNNRRLNGIAADAGSTALNFDALLAKCGLTNLGAGYAWAYCRNFNSCTDRPFNSDAVYIELWGRDSSTFIVHVVDWIAQKDAWRTKNNGTWNTTWNLINNRASGNSAVAYTNYSSNFTTMEDYTGVTRQAWRAGSMAGVAFHLKCKCTTACTSSWYYIGTVAEHFRPQARVAISCTLWSMGEGSMAIGGDINTDGRIRVWINTLATNDNVQFRVNASWMIN